jgi:predicted nucleic acid-binding protein
MSHVLVDTDVVSFFFRHDSRAELYRPHLIGQVLVISFMTLAELDRWAMRRNWGASRRTRLEEHLRKFVVYPFHRELCRQWAEVSEAAWRRGHPIACADAWIAATAHVHGIPLVTHNRRHFAGVDDLRILSARH